MKQYDERKAGVILSYINIICKVLIGFLYVPILISFIGQKNFGIYQLCTSFVGYLTILNAGMNAAYIRFYVQAKTREGEKGVEKLNGMFLIIFSVLAFAAIIFGMAAAGNPYIIFGGKITPEEYVLVKKLLILLTINTAATIENCVFSSLLIANEKFVIEKGITLFITILTGGVNVLVLYLGMGAVGVTCSTTICSVISLIILGIICFSRLHVKFTVKKLDYQLFWLIMSFSVFIFIQSLMDQLNWQLDKFLLARFCGSGEIAVYSLGSQLNTYYIFFAGTISGVFLPQINKYVAMGNCDFELSSLFIKVARIQFIIVVYIMLGFICLGQYFIKLWAGNGFDNSYFVALFLMLPVTIGLTQTLGQDIMRAKNRHQLQIIINIVICLLNLLISIPLCKRYGAVGGAAGTSIGVLLMNTVVQFIYYKRIGNIDMTAYCKEMFLFIPSLILPGICGMIILKMNLVTSFTAFVICGIVFSIIYFMSMWIIGLNREEKELVLKILHTKMFK